MSWRSIRQDRSVWLFCALIFGLLLAVFGVSLANDFVRWDDGLLIYENAAIREITLRSLTTIFTTFDPELYIPFTLFNYQVLYLLFGQQAWGYHLWSLLLHTSNALLGAWLVSWITGNKKIGMVTGLLFALHPIQVEAVSWASALKDQLSTLFYLLTIVAYLHSRDLGSKKAYWWSIIFMLFGLLSKVMVVTLPVILLLLDDLAERRWWTTKALLEKVPYFLLSIIFGLVAIFGKEAVISSTTPVETGLMALRSTIFYLQKIFWPTGFSVLYPYNELVSLANTGIVISGIICILLIALVLIARKWTRFPSTAILFFLVTLVPTFVNFSKGGNLYVASDRYAYLPSLGIFLLIATISVMIWETQTKNMRMILNSILALTVAIFCVLSFQLTKVWANSELLFRNVLKHYPDSYAAHNNIGNVLRRRNDLDGAILEFKAALASWDHEKVRSNLGAVYAKKGMVKEAEEQFAAAEKLNPGTGEPDFGRGILYASIGQYNKALDAYTRALEKDPNFSIVYVNRGSLLLDLGRRAEAEADFRKAIEIEPYLAQAHFNLAALATRDGNMDEAIARYKDVVRMQPYFAQARLNLGALYAKKGQLRDAKRQFLAILEADPDNATAQAALEQIETIERDY